MGLYLFSKNTEGPPSEGNLGTQVGAELTASVWGCGAPRADGTAQNRNRHSVSSNQVPLLTHADMCEATAHRGAVTADVDRCHLAQVTW